MNIQTGFSYVDGTAARAISEEKSIVVSLDNAFQSRGYQTRTKSRSSQHTAAGIKRNLLGAQCAFTKLEYALGMAICFGGGVLMIVLEHLL